MKKKGFLAAALLLSLPLLSGCDSMVRERAMEDISALTIETGAQVPEQDAFADETRRVTLYTLSDDRETLVPVVREIACTGGESVAQAALDALMDELDLEEVAAGRAAALTLSSGIATVNLPARYRALEPQALFAVRQAVANTLGGLSGISYCNVLVGGREEGLDLGATTPVGTLTRAADLDMRALYNRLDDQRMAGTGYTRLTTLYVPTADGKWLLPTVRTVAYPEGAMPIDCLYAALEQLGSMAPDSAVTQDMPAPMDYIEEMPDILQESGETVIEIRFNGDLPQALADSGLTMGIYAGMLTDTLMGIVPGMDGIRMLVEGKEIDGFAAEDMPSGQTMQLAGSLAVYADFDSMIGAPVTLYRGNGEGSLIRSTAVLASGEAENPRAILEAWMEQNGYAKSDVLAISTEEKNVVVHLSAPLGEALEGMDETQARTAVYAMVNTLTQGRTQQGVIFFFDGRQLGELAGGLSMRGRLVRNPGMVVESDGSMGVL